ncbi:uncharacterized protein [Aegilops tauschii subsp. strangulata]|uniref:uncharacterized protein n=1 Tax=Aegilops tauschii subsp. strangulata TaxID=200361 RepID=UPI001E1CA81A|nr:uncharacterized protein LOC123497015 [Aegilops tauschii subsp. strangulata]
MFRTFFENVRIKIACRDPTKIPFERLIEMKKKLFLLGFTVEGFEQTGGADSVIDIDEDEDGNEEDERAEEEQAEKDNGTQGEHVSEGSGGDLAIDELDKANFSTKHGSSNKYGAQKLVVTPMEYEHDADQENFIMECALTAVELDGTSSDGHKLKSGCVGNLTEQNQKTDGEGKEDEGVVTQKTPSPFVKNVTHVTPEQSAGSMEYCEDLLRLVDISDSENEESKEEELGVLPREAVQILQSETWKRSLLESLNQTKSDEAIHEKKPRWGPVLAQRPATRGHGNVNIMEKAAAYKRKKNLEIPQTFKGAKMAKYTMCFGPVGGNDQAMENPMFRGSGCASSPVLKAVGPPERGIA